MTRPLQSGSIAVYNAIEKIYSLDGIAPGYKMLMAETGFTSKSTIAHHLDRLEEAGWIIRERTKHFAIVPVHYPRVHYRRAHHDAAWLYAPVTNTHSCPDCNAAAQRNRQPQPNTDGNDHEQSDTQRNIHPK